MNKVTETGHPPITKPDRGSASVLRLSPPKTDPVAVFVDSPHSGCEYPADFTPLVPLEELRRVEDAYVDELFGAAPTLGIGLLAALFPRSYIDPNRAVSDIDPDFVDGVWKGPMRPSEKSRMGHGLVWRSYPTDRALYKGRLSVSEIQHRIDEFWTPYHACLSANLTHLHERFGGVWHINAHSMPTSSSPFVPGKPGARADFVLGDRDGTSCERSFTEFVRERLQGLGYAVRINDPYRGAELVKVHGKPFQNRHSLQIEINRSMYMNEATLEKSVGFDRLQKDLGWLLSEVACFASMRVSRAAAAE